MKDGDFCLQWLFHLKLLKLYYCMKCDVHGCFAGFFGAVLAYVVSREGLQTIESQTWYGKGRNESASVGVCYSCF